MKKTKHSFSHYLLVILLTFTKSFPLAVFFAGLTYLGYLLYFYLFSPVNLIAAIALVGIGLSMLVVNLSEKNGRVN